MTLNEKNLVLRSFAQVMPIAETAAELFYGRLFELDPTLRPMFRGDMRERPQADADAGGSGARSRPPA
jgi:hypothetical protein